MKSAEIEWKVGYGSVTDWVLHKLSTSAFPISITSFYKWSVEEEITIKKHTIRQLLSDLTKQGRIVRVKRGMYKARENAFSMNARSALLRVRSSEVKTSLIGMARSFKCVLEDDIIYFELLLVVWKKESSLITGNTNTIEGCIKECERKIQERKEVLKNLID